MFHEPKGLVDTFRHAGISQGWLEYYDTESFPSEIVADKEEYVSYLEGAHERLAFQSIVSDTLPKIEKIRGWEVGDDRMDQSHSPTGLAVGLCVQSKVFKMETSEEDTFISCDRFNFCEVTSVIPRTIVGSYDHFRKSGNLSDLEFVDVMPLRLVLPVSKTKGSDHSSSAIGKASMAGVKQSFSRDDLREEMFFTNYLQDGYLQTHKSPEPKYLPTIMGGSGSPACYADYRNLYLYMMAYKGGGYSRVYGTSVNEIRDTLFRMETGRGYAVPHFTLKLRDKQEYLHGTFAEKVFVPSSSFQAKERGRMPPPIYELGGANNSLASYEARLLAAKVLVTRTQAEVEVERTDRVNDILFGFETVSSLGTKKKALSREGRANFEGALSANTAFANLLRKEAGMSDVHKLMKDKNFQLVLSGAREFTLDHAKWVNDGMSSDTYSIRDILRSQDMFLRSEVSTEEDMMVSGISRLWVREGREVITETRAQVGLWKVSPGLYDWAHKVGGLLVQAREDLETKTIPRPYAARIFLENREMVSDDPMIVEMLIQKTKEGIPTDSVCVITQDRKLCKSAATKTGIKVLRLSTYAMPYLFEGNSMESEIMSLEGGTNLIGKLVNFPGNPRILYTMVDTGSLSEMLMKHEVSNIGEGVATYRSQSVRHFSDEKGRHEVFSYIPTDVEATVEASFLRSKKDSNGHPLFELHQPEKSVISKLPKFESYQRGSDVSSYGTASSKGSISKRRKRPPMSELE